MKHHLLRSSLLAFSLLALAPLAALATVTATTPPVAASSARKPSADWSKAMAEFAQDDATNPSPKGVVLFVGSSSIRLWTSIATDFPGLQFRNRGFGGSQIVDSLVHFDRLVKPHQPRLIVFYAGTNDISSGKKTPEAVAADFREFCTRVHAIAPEAHLLYIGAQQNPARWSLHEKMSELNALVATFCATDARLKFVDPNLAMLAPDGTPRPEFFGPDKLHMSPAGYAMWRQILAPFIVP